MANERELNFSDLAVRHIGWQMPAVSTDRRPVAVMIAFWIIAIFAGTSHSSAVVLELGFTPAALAIGFWLWRASAADFLSFIWQLFFFGCFIRRLADFQLGWNAVNPIIVAPYVTSLWCGIALLRPSRAFMRSFGLVAVGILWALAIGVLRNGIPAAGFSMLEWSAGPLIALYLLTLPNQIDAVKTSLAKTAVIGVIVMAVYGISQYLVPLAWDRAWIVSADMESVIGLEAGNLRVFSTMNSPWPFGMVLMALLVFTIGLRGSLPPRTVAVASGIVALIASQTRAAWGGLFVGWILLVIVAGRSRRQMLATAGVLAMIGGLAVIAMPSTGGLTDRIATLAVLGSDDSLSVRTHFYRSFLIDAFSEPIGTGFGKTGVATRLSSDGSMLHFDSGLMNVPFVLGWVGLLAYGAGFTGMIVTVMRHWRQLSGVGLAAAAACMGLLSQMIFLNSLIAASGVIFWTLLGVCMLEVNSTSVQTNASQTTRLNGNKEINSVD